MSDRKISYLYTDFRKITNLIAVQLSRNLEIKYLD